MHTHEDPKTGVTFNYNPDLSGMVIIHPSNTKGMDARIEVPGQALESFMCSILQQRMISRVEDAENLDALLSLIHVP